jgi:outer membrane immunogenic protein
MALASSALALGYLRKSSRVPCAWCMYLASRDFKTIMVGVVGQGRHLGDRKVFSRRLLPYLIVLAGIAGPALAADDRPSASEIAGQPDWSGVYAGFIGGYSRGFANQRGIGADFGSGDYTMSGGFAGGSLGFNYQFGQWVIGLDSEFSGARISSSNEPFFSSKMDTIFTVRARIGYSVGNFLPYIGLGPSYTHFSSVETFPGAVQISDSRIRSGWTFAAGADYMILPNLSARFEYMYICFGADIVGNTDNIELMGHYARVGLNYKLEVPGLRREETSSDTARTGRGYNWSGVYVGPSVGGSAVGQSTSVAVNNVPIGNIQGLSAGGIVGFGLQGTVGAQAGANWQVGQYVFGVESDFHLSELTGAGTSTNFFVRSGATLGKLSQSSTIDEQGTVRARVGVAFDRWLVYATVGLAYGSYESSPNFSLLPGQSVSADFESTRIGPVAGLGVERAIWSQWTTRIEYMYADFGRPTYSLSAVPPFGVVSSRATVGEHILRVGFNRLFN